MTVLHSGFDGLKFTIQTDIPPEFRAALADAKAQAIKTNADCVLDLPGLSLAVRRNGGSAFSAHTGEFGAEWYFAPESAFSVALFYKDIGSFVASTAQTISWIW